MYLELVLPCVSSPELSGVVVVLEGITDVSLVCASLVGVSLDVSEVDGVDCSVDASVDITCDVMLVVGSVNCVAVWSSEMVSPLYAWLVLNSIAVSSTVIFKALMN